MIIIRNKCFSEKLLEEQREYGIFDYFKRTSSLGDPSMSNIKPVAVPKGNSRQRRSASYRTPRSGILNSLPQGHNINVATSGTPRVSTGPTMNFNTARQNMPKPGVPKIKRYQKFNTPNGVVKDKSLKRLNEIINGVEHSGEKSMAKYNKLIDSGDIKAAQDKMIRRSRRVNRFEGLDKLTTGRTKGDRWNNLSIESRNKIRESRRANLGRGILSKETPMIGSGTVGLTKEQRIARLSNQNQVNYYRNIEHAKNPENYAKWGEKVTITPKTTSLPSTSPVKTPIQSTTPTKKSILLPVKANTTVTTVPTKVNSALVNTEKNIAKNTVKKIPWFKNKYVLAGAGLTTMTGLGLAANSRRNNQ